MITQIKKGDTNSVFTDILMVDGNPISLAGAMVSFIIKNELYSIKRTAENLGTPTGKVRYQLGLVPADVANAGTFHQEWEVVFNDDSVLTFPNGGYNIVHILDDLG